jgi:hypothetical protein
MFEVKTEGLEAILKTFDTIHKQVEALHKEMPRQLVDWQTEDMRRKYPNVHVDETPQLVEATTEVWPRSRLEEPGAKRPGRPVVNKGPTIARPKGIGRPAPSTRPILRTELFRKLTDRMDELLKAIKWQ